MGTLESGGPRQQLPLEIRPRDEATFSNFLALDAHRAPLEALEHQLSPGGEHLVYLCGPAGVGKSHLLQACCQSAGHNELYLPLAQLRDYPPAEVLQGVAEVRRVCLDDLEAVVADPVWEEALFHLCNRAREQHCRVVVAANAAPRAIGLRLADLQSRLSGGVVFRLEKLDDREKADILRFRAHRRGLTLSPITAGFIVARASRELEQLLALLDILDHASLAEQRPLSIPFVKQALGW
tara:strand:+ start:17787 stop:18500 length:714 start_codon:yes stop_codon:yes gene_type:complete